MCGLAVSESYIGGQDVTELVSMGKLKSGRLVREVADKCLQFWGGMGFTNEVGDEPVTAVRGPESS